MLKKSLLILLGTIFLAPAVSFAQGNNMDIYNKTLRDYNHPSQKKWQKEEAEATMLDVDEIVRREEEQRRRQQGLATPPPSRPTSRVPASCTEGKYYGPSGCGVYGIDNCCCIGGRLAPCRGTERRR